MKLSIWQQFSSNHSSHFIVVGRFQDASVAKVKGDQLRDWLYRMLWGNQVERRIAEDELIATYQIKWYEDGMSWNGRPNNIDEAVRQLHTDVFVICPVETWDSHDPFIELIEKMGSLSIVENSHGDGYSEGLWTNIKCIAPTSIMAEEIAAVVKHGLDEAEKPYDDRYKVPMPWTKYSPKLHEGSIQLTLASYDELEKQWLQNHSAWLNFYKTNSVDAYGNKLPYAQIKHLWQQRNQFITQDPTLNAHIAELRQDVDIFGGEVKLDGKTVVLERIRCACVDIFLIAFVRWLENLGCKVEYEFQK